MSEAGQWRAHRNTINILAILEDSQQCNGPLSGRRIENLQAHRQSPQGLPDGRDQFKVIFETLHRS